MVEASLAEWRAGDPLHVTSTRFPMDRALVTCLVDRWRPDTHTFHFPWGEMALTLQDVSCLLGLPLAGEAVGPLEPPDDWRADLAQRFGAAVPGVEDVLPDTHGPRETWLRQFEVSAYRCT
jgi:hypothetical protein